MKHIKISWMCNLSCFNDITHSNMVLEFHFCLVSAIQKHFYQFICIYFDVILLNNTEHWILCDEWCKENIFSFM